VKEACKRMVKQASRNDDDLLMAIYHGASVFLNYTGQLKCVSLAYNVSDALGESGWGFQACTEMVMPMCSNGTDMFEASAWNLTAFAQSCYEHYGVRSRVDWAITNYGGNGRDLKFASNIIFSNGLLDPWYGGGVLRTISDSVVAIVIKDGAHHYDLRGKHPFDTVDVKEARQVEMILIRKWIDKWRSASNRTEKRSPWHVTFWISFLLLAITGKTSY